MWAGALWPLCLLFGGAWAGLAPAQTCLAPALPRSDLRKRVPYAKEMLLNCDDEQFPGRVLQIYKPVCYANYTYHVPCESTTKRKSFSVEWHGHTMGMRMNPADFKQMLADHESDWLHGTTYGTAVLYFPHAAQALIAMLNVPLLGDTLERFVINHFDPGAHGRTWDQHYNMFYKARWLKDLSECIMECLGVTIKRGDEAFYHDYNFNAPMNPILPPRATPPRMLCFDKLVVPYNQLTCGRHFIDSRREAALWSAFRAHVFNRYGIRPLKSAPIRIGFMERFNDRRILNQDEVLRLIKQKTGITVSVIRFDYSMGLDVQVRSVAGFHLLIGPHGANLMNCLFLSPGSTIIEVYTRNYTMACYYGDLLKASGISYMRYCGDTGICSDQVVSGFGQYDRADVAINAEYLASMAAQVVLDLRQKRLSSRPKLLGGERPYRSLRRSSYNSEPQA